MNNSKIKLIVSLITNKPLKRENIKTYHIKKLIISQTKIFKPIISIIPFIGKITTNNC